MLFPIINNWNLISQETERQQAGKRHNLLDGSFGQPYAMTSYKTQNRIYTYHIRFCYLHTGLPSFLTIENSNGWTITKGGVQY